MLTVEDLTERTAGRLNVIAPELHAVREGDDRIRVETGSRRLYVGVQEAYIRYLDDPDHHEQIVVDAALRILGMIDDSDAEPTSADILPVVRDRRLPEAVKAHAAASGAEVVELLTEKLNDELVVVYVLDTPSSLSFIGEPDIGRLGVRRPHLRDLAIGNLYRRIPTVGSQEYDGLLLLTAGGVYESSLLLLDYLWNDFLPIDGSAVVAVPNRDVLLVTGDKDVAGVKRMREIARRSFEDEAYPITPQPFIRRGDRWETI